MSTKKILTPEEANTVTPDLPPKGPQRANLLAKNKDELEQAAEEASADRGTIAPETFTVDREIAQRLPMLEGVTGRLPDYEYAWIYAPLREQGKWLAVVQKGLERVRSSISGQWVPVWEVVQGSMPEARDALDVNNHRRVGDTILMRAPRARYEAWWAHLEDKRKRALGVADDQMQAMAERAGISIFPMHAAIGGRLSETQKRAFDHLATKLKFGTVPGIPAPGEGR